MQMDIYFQRKQLEFFSSPDACRVQLKAGNQHQLFCKYSKQSNSERPTANMDVLKDAERMECRVKQKHASL